jgi:hypothetical protein
MSAPLTSGGGRHGDGRHGCGLVLRRAPSLRDGLDHDEINEREAPDGETALHLLQSIYRNKLAPLPVRIRCAVEGSPYENPKLSAVAVASLNGNSFAAALDRAIARSRSVPLIEAKSVEPPQAE